MEYKLELRTNIKFCDVLQPLRGEIHHRRSEMWRRGDFLLHHDNAPAHRALATRQFFSHNSMTTLPHPPYSPDLAPCDFFLFLKMKLKLNGCRFENVHKIQCESQMVLDTIHEQDFQGAFQQRQKCSQHCITAQGDYFEGDHSQA